LTAAPATMRDIFLETLRVQMKNDRRIFFLTADFGAPSLDAMREDFPERVINVGIAEQNLVNVAAGLALEKKIVYAYAIAPFLVMRAFEQIRNNVSLLSGFKELNVNLIGVGAGISYDLSGPTHHCLEDISLVRVLPNMVFFSPSDGLSVRHFVPYSVSTVKPKYIRLDGKPLPDIYDSTSPPNLASGFCRLRAGTEICVVSTGFMTHRAMAVADRLSEEGATTAVIDVFMLKTLDRDLLSRELGACKVIVTLEEGFIGKGGLDSLVLHLLAERQIPAKFKAFGFEDEYVCAVGNRSVLHKRAGLDEEGMTGRIGALIRQGA
jgi:transketolase